MSTTNSRTYEDRVGSSDFRAAFEKSCGEANEEVVRYSWQRTSRVPREDEPNMSTRVSEWVD
jgi:hypothetical protein